jgi:hypothetical protein
LIGGRRPEFRPRAADGDTRTITLPSNLVAPGTTGVVANVTAVDAAHDGYLSVYPANTARPAASTLNFLETDAIANMVILGVSAGHQIKVYASQSVHLIIDVTGTIA